MCSSPPWSIAEQECQSTAAQEKENADEHQLRFSAINWAAILFLINEKAKLLLLSDSFMQKTNGSLNGSGPVVKIAHSF